MADEYAWSWLQQRIGALEDHWPQMLKRLVILEQQVANQAVAMKKTDDTALKSQAAAAQATEHLYAPLRSDTKPLLDMAAFVRKVASINPDHVAYSMYHAVRELVEEAQDILKRST